MVEKKHDRLIVLDFDHTLFNTTLFVAAMKKRFADEFGIGEEEFMTHRNQIKQCKQVIDIENFVKSFDGHDAAKLRDAVHDVIKTQAPTFIFSDVPDFFERHKDRFDFLVSTHGDCELQTEKITHSQLPDYVDHIISVRGKDDVLADYIAPYEKVYFVDDKSTNIDAVKQAHPDVTTYFVRRPEDMPYGDTPSTCDCDDFQVEDLGFAIA